MGLVNSSCASVLMVEGTSGVQTWPGQTDLDRQHSHEFPLLICRLARPHVRERIAGGELAFEIENLTRYLPSLVDVQSRRSRAANVCVD